MKTVTLQSVPDETPETNESFQIVLSNATTTGTSICISVKERRKFQAVDFACTHIVYIYKERTLD